MKTSMLLFVSLCLLAGVAHAEPRLFVGQATIGHPSGPALQPYYYNSSRTLDPDTLYTVRSQVYFEEGTTLTIPANTLILGEPAGTIIIKKGAQIFVNGTLEQPVIMTSNRPVGQRATGDWGGLVVLGRAPINLDPNNTTIEGGIIEGNYGGNDALDSSGVIKYVRIEYAGYRFEEGNEINGLTLGGVGAGTELHHVQVSYANDDAYEFFGGTVDGHHLVSFAPLDECYDVDDGYTGRWQFLFGVMDPNVSDPTGSTLGFEHDSRNELQPYSLPVISNCTLVGPERIDALVGNLPAGHTHQNLAVLRENTRSSIFNSVFVGFARGLSLRDGSIQAAQDNLLRIRNTSVSSMYTGYTGANCHDTGRWANIVTWFDTEAYANEGATPRLPSTVGLTDLSDLTDLQPQPLLFSELDGTADFGDAYLADVAGRYTFDTAANYRGAFVPDLPMDQQWTAGWTNFDPQNEVYVLGVVAVDDDQLPLAQAQINIYPNPFNPLTTLEFSVPRAGIVSVQVYDVAGRLVAELHNGHLAAGQFSVNFDGATLSSGTYFARLQGDGFTANQKMQLVK